MPYRRRSNWFSVAKPFLRHYVGRRRGISGDGTLMAAAALKGVRQVKQMINVEKKFHDVNHTTAPTSSGAITLLSGIAQGDTVSTRDGNSAKAISIYARGLFTQHASATTERIRVVIFRDVASNGVVPTITELMEDNNTEGMLNTNNGKRFHVLFDRFLATSITGNQVASFKFYKKLNHKMRWDGTSAAQADCVTGHYYMYLVGSEATNTPSTRINIRIRYVDN